MWVIHVDGNATYVMVCPSLCSSKEEDCPITGDVHFDHFFKGVSPG